MKRASHIPIVIILFSIFAARAAEQPRAGAEGSASPAAPSIDQLAWMAGQWEAPVNDGLFEMMWLPPRSGTMVAMGRLTRDGATALVEFAVIEQTENGVVQRYKHFAPDYTPWEKERPITMQLEQADERMMAWERDGAGNPRAISLHLGDDGTVTARLEVEVDGELRSSGFVMHRVEN